MRLIHITDPHLSSLADTSFFRLRGKRRSGYLSWYKNRRHIHLPKILDQLTAAVHAENPDQILLTGDLVHIGREHEHVEAADWLRRLGSPDRVMLVPGNHDLYAADSLASISRLWKDYLPGATRHDDPASGFPQLRDLGDVRLIGLNSSLVTRIFSAAGELGMPQLAAYPGVFERGRFHVLLIHHPPLPGMTKRRKALRDAQQLERAIQGRAPGLLLYGHIHVNRESLRYGSWMFCTASASSCHDASYRVFDITRETDDWSVRMRLHTLADGDGAARFPLAADSRWTITDQS